MSRCLARAPCLVQGGSTQGSCYAPPSPPGHALSSEASLLQLVRGQHACPHRLASCANAPAVACCARGHMGLQAALSSGQHRAQEDSAEVPQHRRRWHRFSLMLRPPAPAAGRSRSGPWATPGKGSDHSHTSHGRSGSSAHGHTPPAGPPSDGPDARKTQLGRDQCAKASPLWPGKGLPEAGLSLLRTVLNAHSFQKEAQKCLLSTTETVGEGGAAVTPPTYHTV